MTKKLKPASPSRTLGPIVNLEQHLPADWWRTLFNATYLKTDGDVVENEVNTAREVDLLLQTSGLAPSDAILDLCCGQGRHCLELARRGYRNLTGLDQSRFLIRLARKRARLAGLDVVFLEGDARSMGVPAGSYQCVAILGNSFGYFERAEEDHALLHAARQVLCLGGVLALDLTNGDWVRQHFEPRSWEWIDAAHFVCRERMLSGDGSRLVCREIVIHERKGVLVDQFYAERLYSLESIRQLLDRVGFTSICHQAELACDSDRNQDLGMMAQRMFLTARVAASNGCTNGHTH